MELINKEVKIVVIQCPFKLIEESSFMSIQRKDMLVTEDTAFAHNVWLFPNDLLPLF